MFYYKKKSYRKEDWILQWIPTAPRFFHLVFTILFFYFFKLWKYDNTFTGDLEDTEQGYI